MNTKQLLEVTRVRELARAGTARQVRQRAGLSLSEVAAAVGVSTATVFRWERGQRRPTGAAALRYARMCQTLMNRTPAGHGDSQV